MGFVYLQRNLSSLICSKLDAPYFCAVTDMIFFSLILKQRGGSSSAPCLLFCSRVCRKKSEYIKDAHLKPPPIRSAFVNFIMKEAGMLIFPF